MTRLTRTDLHIHTMHSDGSYEPRELVQLAKRTGFSTIAITDHDALGAIDEAVVEGGYAGVRVVPGVELSTLCDDNDTHIVGLFIDHKHPGLVELVERAALERRGRIVRMKELLCGLGVEVSADELLAELDGPALGRLHMAELLVQQGVTASIGEAFYKYIGDDGPAHVAKWSPTPEECCRAIRDAGGVPVYAHPGEVIDEQGIARPVDAGCGAIEAFYPTYSKTLTTAYIKLAARMDVGVSGGSDCHGTRKNRVLFGKVSVPEEFVNDLESRCG